ncbi:MAG: hypothetical protein KDJ98_08100 [Rhodobacteraceae bacterium]|nr:hypothetical protein [Paracoccaceae bacterium]
MGEASILQILALSMIVGAGGAFGVRAGQATADLFEGMLALAVVKLRSWWRSAYD